MQKQRNEELWLFLLGAVVVSAIGILITMFTEQLAWILVAFVIGVLLIGEVLIYAAEQKAAFEDEEKS
ncbi:hypothetical protein [Caryophanon tenue]|uniref:Uncharacterized protein n=1 Tax=Caryophanon tenue TaxID=33978 RepID=A0A1C0Y787_9BACL|nr:hypothetical protein [Caryophanon tenue]OCS83014.1 hypothetical protein A6M13_06325 [Caryophanon tenue]